LMPSRPGAVAVRPEGRGNDSRGANSWNRTPHLLATALDEYVKRLLPRAAEPALERGLRAPALRDPAGPYLPLRMRGLPLR